MFSSRAARTTIAVALTVAIAALFAIQAREAKVRSDRMVGVLLDRGEDAVRVDEVVADMPAARAGLLPDDEILAVNGHPLDKLIDYDIAAEDFERGTPVELVVRRGGDTMTPHRRAGGRLSPVPVHPRHPGSRSATSAWPCWRSSRGRATSARGCCSSSPPPSASSSPCPTSRSATRRWCWWRCRPTTCSPASRWPSSSTSRRSSRGATGGSSAGRGWYPSTTSSASGSAPCAA